MYPAMYYNFIDVLMLRNCPDFAIVTTKLYSCVLLLAMSKCKGERNAKIYIRICITQALGLEVRRLWRFQHLIELHQDGQKLKQGSMSHFVYHSFSNINLRLLAFKLILIFIILASSYFFHIVRHY